MSPQLPKDAAKKVSNFRFSSRRQQSPMLPNYSALNTLKYANTHSRTHTQLFTKSLVRRRIFYVHVEKYMHACAVFIRKINTSPKQSHTLRDAWAVLVFMSVYRNFVDGSNMNIEHSRTKSIRISNICRFYIQKCLIEIEKKNGENISSNML